ncbi:two-component system, OmpR family, response regulator/two-component system, OmpR family, torCAD operon response regulator TorR [Ruegeria intermedia]|uniref:Regulatory protein VirG n=1 Tax=Ruegeria intermedia TaxID=996115 RepID=A0A1M4ZR36_9RHOB|nr:response regulator transcription factor [Ruegeria intermedia]SHF20267.1 two-component system, OmpR family, response regulator/two-component system, OmpR family, torCAD operon response regulator TorR [Ruegeria intermedia]
MSKEHILVVDDDPQITSFLKRYLEKQSCDVSCAADAVSMEAILAVKSVDLIVLDIGLPGRSGLDITRDLRANSNIPIIVLSGRDDAFDRVVGLEFGADDYVTKPFEARELLARIRTVLRRCRAEGLAARNNGDDVPLIRFGQWVVNFNERTLKSDAEGVSTPLTTTEFDILQAFLKNPHVVFSRNQLLDTARGNDTFVGDRTVDVHIMRLRKKIEPDPSNPSYIKTVHGIGYCFAANVTKVGDHK